MNNFITTQSEVIRASVDVYARSGEHGIYGGLRTRTAVLEHVRRSFARSGVHCPTNPKVIVTLTRVGCKLWGYIKQLLCYRHLINRISRWLSIKTQFKTQFKEVKLIDSKVKKHFAIFAQGTTCTHLWRVLDQRRNSGEQNPLPAAGRCTRLWTFQHRHSLPHGSR